MSQEPCRIVLGERWTAFAQEREGMHMLGTVQRGMQIGALARLADGSYAQVNGDVVEVINKSRVEFALRADRESPPPAGVGGAGRDQEAPADRAAA
jgi:hypothetical protein